MHRPQCSCPGLPAVGATLGGRQRALGSQRPGREGRVLFLLFRHGKERGSQDTELLLLPNSPGIGDAMSQKFLITMANESVVDVTRSYYYMFKSEFGI